MYLNGHCAGICSSHAGFRDPVLSSCFSVRDPVRGGHAFRRCVIIMRLFFPLLLSYTLANPGVSHCCTTEDESAAELVFISYYDKLIFLVLCLLIPHSSSCCCRLEMQTLCRRSWSFLITFYCISFKEK